MARAFTGAMTCTGGGAGHRQPLVWRVPVALRPCTFASSLACACSRARVAAIAWAVFHYAEDLRPTIMITMLSVNISVRASAQAALRFYPGVEPCGMRVRRALHNEGVARASVGSILWDCGRPTSMHGAPYALVAHGGRARSYGNVHATTRLRRSVG